MWPWLWSQCPNYPTHIHKLWYTKLRCTKERLITSVHPLLGGGTLMKVNILYVVSVNNDFWINDFAASQCLGFHHVPNRHSQPGMKVTSIMNVLISFQSPNTCFISPLIALCYQLYLALMSCSANYIEYNISILSMVLFGNDLNSIYK